LLLICCAVAAAAGAQDADLWGRVVAPTGVPVNGARVELRLGAGSGIGMRRTSTDGDGHWRVSGLESGVWSIEIKANGYQTARGRVEVGPATAPVDVALEVDHDAAVRAWLEEANTRLAEGSGAAAQALYERALSVIQEDRAAPVYRALARAYFLQGEVDDAARALQSALLTDPADSEARLLLPRVLASAGRETEAEQWLDLLAREGAAAAARAAFAVEVPERDLASRPRGRFHTTLSEPAPQANAERFLGALGSWENLGVEPTAPWSITGESFEAYVPEPEVPESASSGASGEAAADRPYGLFVWISPTPRGGLTDREMTAVLDSERMIWIGANDSGNTRPRADRIRLALAAAHGLRATYPIDPERVYVGGYSGGGRMASLLAIHFPDVFTGGVYFMGVDFYRHVAKTDQPGTQWGGVLEPPTPAARGILEGRSRFVFITGTHDFNRAQTYAYRDQYLADGLERVTLIEIPDVGHLYGFRAAELDAALEALDRLRP
jgi:tetratricopeptide (TPR) repeat protein